jgi:hypothetical protein
MKLHYYPETDSLYIELKSTSARDHTSPCQELADDLGWLRHRAHAWSSMTALIGKRGPMLDRRRDWRAERRPPCPATDPEP